MRPNPEQYEVVGLLSPPDCVVGFARINLEKAIARGLRGWTRWFLGRMEGLEGLSGQKKFRPTSERHDGASAAVTYSNLHTDTRVYRCDPRATAYVGQTRSDGQLIRFGSVGRTRPGRIITLNQVSIGVNFPPTNRHRRQSARSLSSYCR